MSGSLRGRRALVTGASRGIGAGTALRLAAEGAHVALVARTLHDGGDLPGSLHAAGSLDATAARMAPFGGRVVSIEADLCDPASRSKIVPEAIHGLGGPIEILVNNAAAGIYRPLAQYSERHRTKMLEINLNAPLELMQAVLPGMRARGEGWIVNVSSGDARPISGPPFHTTPLTHIHGFYGTTKAALNRLTNAFAVEVYEHGIRCNGVEPRAAVATEGALAKGLDGIPDHMIESLEAMVEAIVALCACERDLTARSCVSLDLLDELQREVRSLDGKTTHPGGDRGGYRRQPT